MTIEQIKQEREIHRAQTDLEIMKIQDQMLVNSVRSQQVTTALFLEMKENYMRALLDPDMPEEQRKSLLGVLSTFEKQ